jgi:hypothetical protein
LKNSKNNLAVIGNRLERYVVEFFDFSFENSYMNKIMGNEYKDYLKKIDELNDFELVEEYESLVSFIEMKLLIEYREVIEGNIDVAADSLTRYGGLAHRNYMSVSQTKASNLEKVALGFSVPKVVLLAIAKNAEKILKYIYTEKLLEKAAIVKNSTFKALPGKTVEMIVGDLIEL